MDITLKAIEEINLTSTQEKIIVLLSKLSENKTTLRYIDDNIDVLYVTICNEIKKLVNKDILYIVGSEIHLTSFGFKILNYYNFKMSVLKEFCNKNSIDEENYLKFIKSRNYNNLNLLLGIKNLM